MKRDILEPADLAKALSTLDGWQADGTILKKRYTFENFDQAHALIDKIAPLADAADHHPDICFGWGYAEISLTTHDRGGITDVDIALAKQIDEM